MAAPTKKSRGVKNMKKLKESTDLTSPEGKVSKKPKPTWSNLIALDSNKQDSFEKRVEKLKKTVKAKADLKATNGGVICLGMIPHGFYEPQMTSFFSQFGKLTRLKLLRSKKTGGSKGTAFIEFQHEEVAHVVAETMNNYLMFNKLLQCRVIPPSNCGEWMFRNWKRIVKNPMKHYRNQVSNNKDSKPETFAKNLKKHRAKRQQKLDELAQLGFPMSLHIKDGKITGDASAHEERLKLSEKQTTKKPSNKIAKEDEDLSKLKQMWEEEGSENSDGEWEEKLDGKKKNLKKKAKKRKKTADNDDAADDSEDDLNNTHVLLDDSTDLDITFKTPPHTVRSNKKATPAKTKITETVPKRKLELKKAASRRKTGGIPSRKKVKR